MSDISTSFSGRNNPRILLVGTAGQVGSDLLPLLESLGHVTALSRADLDLSDAGAIRAAVRDARPHWIVNAAAYTAVDKAESDRNAAHAINSEAPGVLGDEAARLSAAVIHLSTDYVFDGSGSKPWSESDRTGPLNVYGSTKLAGEQALAQSGAAHYIFRTSWVYAAHGNNFLRTMLRLAKERDELKIVDDQFGAPTWSYELAKLITAVMSRSDSEAANKSMPVVQYVRERQGVYHATSSGETTWYAFASEFLRLLAGSDPMQKLAALTPISSAEYPTPAKRPRNSRLNCSRLAEVFGYALPTWQESTASVMAQLISGSTK